MWLEYFLHGHRLLRVETCAGEGKSSYWKTYTQKLKQHDLSNDPSNWIFSKGTWEDRLFSIFCIEFQYVFSTMLTISQLIQMLYTGESVQEWKCLTQ